MRGHLASLGVAGLALAVSASSWGCRSADDDEPRRGSSTSEKQKGSASDAGRGEGGEEESESGEGDAEGASRRIPDGEKHVRVSGHDIELDTGDYPKIEERGTIRVLVPSTREAFLPRNGTPAEHDRRLMRRFAERRDLDVKFVLVPQRDQLLPMLLEGRGDVVAAQLTATDAREEKVDFTWALNTVDELVVGPEGADNPPVEPADLDGREVHVRGASSYAETLEQLNENEEQDVDVDIVEVPEYVDTPSIVEDVSIGDRPLTVCDSHILKSIETYNDDFERLFVLREGRDIAWAVRPDNPKLESKLNSFLIESALTNQPEERFTGDLAGIRERGVLRVLTRNNPVTYFLYRGEPKGFEYELVRHLAKKLDVRLEMVVPPSREDLIPWLLEGRGDIIAASMTVTPDRSGRVTFSKPYLKVDELLVGKTEGDEVGDGEETGGYDDRAGKLASIGEAEIHVRPKSSYYDTLQNLDERVDDFDPEIVEAPGTVETRVLLEQVAEGTIPYTVSDSHIFQVEKGYRKALEPVVMLTGGLDEEPKPRKKIGIEGAKEIAFAMRPDATELESYIDEHVDDLFRSTRYNMLRRRYFQQHGRISKRRGSRPSDDDRISRYDELIKRYSQRYDLDWRLMAALAYQESGFNPNAESWVGAQGLFQVMPSTGADLGFHNLKNPTSSTHAGIKYFHQILSTLSTKIPFDERIKFALAGYNAGIGHVADGRRLATREGMDEDVWFDNVEEAMLMLMKRKYYRNARYGYVRGSEAVKYVREITGRYETYTEHFSDE